MKQLRVLLLPLDGMLVHRRVTPSSMSPVPIYTPGWRETMWVKFLVWGNNTVAGTRPWTTDLQIWSATRFLKNFFGTALPFVFCIFILISATQYCELLFIIYLCSNHYTTATLTNKRNFASGLRIFVTLIQTIRRGLLWSDLTSFANSTSEPLFTVYIIT